MANMVIFDDFVQNVNFFAIAITPSAPPMTATIVPNRRRYELFLSKLSQILEFRCPSANKNAGTPYKFSNPTFRMHEHGRTYAEKITISDKQRAWGVFVTVHANTILDHLKKLTEKVHQSCDFGPFSASDLAGALCWQSPGKNFCLKKQAAPGGTAASRPTD